MAQPAKPVALLNDFPGLMENVDPIDEPAGAAEVQVNAVSIRVGELTVRRGLRQVTFDN